MGPSRRHTRSAGISSGTGVQKWTRPVNSLPYLTLPLSTEKPPTSRGGNKERKFKISRTCGC